MPVKKRAIKKAAPKKKVAAKKAAPRVSPEKKNLKLVEETFAAFEAHDLDKVVSYFADDFTFTDVPSGREIKGDRAALKDYFGTWLKAFPDARTEFTSRIASKDSVVMEFTGTGTHSGELLGVSPTGKKVSIPFVEVFKLKGGKIVSDKLYYDSATLLRQLGASPQGAQPSGQPGE